MTVFLVTLGYIVLLVLAAGVERALTRKWDDERMMAERQQMREIGIAARETKVRERAMTLEEQKFERTAQQMLSDPMPVDLAQRIGAYEDDWAQDLERSRIMELYGTLKDWDKVARALPPLVA